jgi:hypothetical protein
MVAKNLGPCSVVDCTYTNVIITQYAFQEERMLKTYSYLEVGKQLCHPHYCKIMEPNRGRRDKRNMSKGQEAVRKGLRTKTWKEKGKVA